MPLHTPLHHTSPTIARLLHRIPYACVVLLPRWCAAGNRCGYAGYTFTFFGYAGNRCGYAGYAGYAFSWYGCGGVFGYGVSPACLLGVWGVFGFLSTFSVPYVTYVTHVTHVIYGWR